MNHPAGPPQTSDAPDASDAASRSTRRRTAIVIGSVLVIGGVALAVWTVTAGGSSAPQPQQSAISSSSTSVAPPAAASSDASPAPVSSASAPPSIPAGAPVIAEFFVEPTIAVCPDDRASTVPLTFSWTTEGADRAWIGVGTSDASAQPAAEVDLSARGFTGLTFACSDADQVFTLTVQGAGGTKSSTLAITRELE